ncbi:6072_t:CDS:1, partial [Dentiscutata erythropus]
CHIKIQQEGRGNYLERIRQENLEKIILEEVFKSDNEEVDIELITSGMADMTSFRERKRSNE